MAHYASFSSITGAKQSRRGPSAEASALQKNQISRCCGRRVRRRNSPCKQSSTFCRPAYRSSYTSTNDAAASSQRPRLPFSQSMKQISTKAQISNKKKESLFSAFVVVLSLFPLPRLGEVNAPWMATCARRDTHSECRRLFTFTARARRNQFVELK